MREIKFRGKRKDIDWKYGYFTRIARANHPNLPDGCMTAICPINENYITYGVDIESVGQYTGLKDKNGKEIYEGDIINITITHDDPYEGNISRTFRAIIDFQHGGFWFTGIDFNLTDCNWHFYNKSDIEIIGNIYENPGLVEDKK